MSVPIETLQTHLRYTEWASRRLVEAAAQLTEEELTRDFKHSDKSVLGTLVHVMAADRVWIGRIQGNPPAKFVDPETDMHLSALRDEWPKVWDRWRAYAASADPNTVAQYKDTKGNPYSTPIWQIILHLVNHGTHHRGMVSAMLRAMGRTPPPVDLSFFYRETAR